MKKFLKSILLVFVSVFIILQTGCFIKIHNTIDKSDKTQSAQLENKDNITNFILGVFEESNAFLHITPYAILNPPSQRMKKTLLTL